MGAPLTWTRERLDSSTTFSSALVQGISAMLISRSVVAQMEKGFLSAQAHEAVGGQRWGA